MVQYYNTGDKDSTNLIAYASDLSMFAMLFTDMQNGTRDYGNDRPIKSVEVAILSTIEQNPGITVSDLSQKQHRTKGTIKHSIILFSDTNNIVCFSILYLKKFHNS